jgi:sugar lactone lactonase YvrE
MRHPAPVAVGILAVVGLVGCGSPGSSGQPVASGAGASITIAASATPSTPATPGASPSTVASSGPIAALDAILVNPTGLVFDATGNLYVSDCSEPTDSVIFRIDTSGTLTTYAGVGGADFKGDGGPAIAANLHCPLGLAIGPDGAFSFADHVNNRIRRIDAAGIITTVVGSGATGVDQGSYSGDGGPATAATISEPYGVAFDRAGNLYISDRDNDRIRKVDPTGVISTIAGNGKIEPPRDGVRGTESSIDFPLGIICDAKGNVLFADANNKRIRKIDGKGIITTIAGTGENLATGDGGPATKAALADPENLAFDAAGNLYITDTVSNTLRRIDSHGVITTLASRRGGNGLAIDAAGNLFVTDAGSSSIQRIDTNGVVTRVAGKPR